MYEIHSIPVRIYITAASSDEAKTVISSGASHLRVGVVKACNALDRRKSAPAQKSLFLIDNSTAPRAIGAVTGLHGHTTGHDIAALLASCTEHEYVASGAAAGSSEGRALLTLQPRAPSTGGLTRQQKILSLAPVVAVSQAQEELPCSLQVIVLLQVACIRASSLSEREYAGVLNGRHAPLDAKQRALLAWAFEQAESAYASYCAWVGRPPQAVRTAPASALPVPSQTPFTDVTSMINGLAPLYSPPATMHPNVQRLALTATKGGQLLEMKSYQKQAVNWMLQRELRCALPFEVPPPVLQHAKASSIPVLAGTTSSASHTQPQVGLYADAEEEQYELEEDEDDDGVCDVDMGGGKGAGAGAVGGGGGGAGPRSGRRTASDVPSRSSTAGVTATAGTSAASPVEPLPCLRALAQAVRARHPLGFVGLAAKDKAVRPSHVLPQEHPLWSAVTMYRVDADGGVSVLGPAQPVYWNPYSGCVLLAQGTGTASSPSAASSTSAGATSAGATVLSSTGTEEYSFDGVQRGGMLCDEPGIGKTVECLGLILTNMHSRLEVLLQKDRQLLLSRIGVASTSSQGAAFDVNAVLEFHRKQGTQTVVPLEAGLLELAAATMGHASTSELKSALLTAPAPVPRLLESALTSHSPRTPASPAPSGLTGGTDYPLPFDDGKLAYASRATVVVMPTNIVEQWREEAAAWAPSLRVEVFEGTAALEAVSADHARKQNQWVGASSGMTPLRRAQLVEQLKCGQINRMDFDSLLSADGASYRAGAESEEQLRTIRAETLTRLCLADVVLVSYDTLANDINYQAKAWATGSGLRQKEAGRSKHIRSPLLSIAWHRIILDESQMIEGSAGSAAASNCSVTSSRRTEMALQLQGPLSYKWCVSGTPFSHAEQVRTLFTFLRHEPFHDDDAARNWTAVLLPLLREGQQPAVDLDAEDDASAPPVTKRARLAEPGLVTNPVRHRLGTGLSLLARLVRPLLWRNTLQRLKDTGELLLPPVEHTVIVARPGPVEQQALQDYIKLTQKDMNEALTAPKQPSLELGTGSSDAAQEDLLLSAGAGMEEAPASTTTPVRQPVPALTGPGYTGLSPSPSATSAGNVAAAEEDEDVVVLNEAPELSPSGAAHIFSPAAVQHEGAGDSPLDEGRLRRSKRKRGEDGHAAFDEALATSTPISHNRELRLLMAAHTCTTPPRSKKAQGTPRQNTDRSPALSSKAVERKLQELSSRATELGRFRLDQLRKMCVLLYLSTDAVEKLQLKLFHGQDTGEYAEGIPHAVRKRGKKQPSVLRLFARGATDATGGSGPSLLNATTTMSSMFRALVNTESREVEEKRRQLYKIMLQLASATELLAEKTKEKAGSANGSGVVTPGILLAQQQARQQVEDALKLYEEGLQLSLDTDIAERGHYSEAAAAVRSFMKLDSTALSGVARLCDALAGWPGTPALQRSAYKERKQEAYKKWNEDVLQPAMAGKTRLELGESIAQARNPLARLDFRGSEAHGARTRTWMHYLARPEHVPDALLRFLAEWAETTKGVVFPFRGSAAAFDTITLQKSQEDRLLPSRPPISLSTVVATEVPGSRQAASTATKHVGVYVLPIEDQQLALWKRLTDVRTCYAHLNDGQIFYNLSNMPTLTPFDSQKKEEQFNLEREAYFNLQSFDHTLQPVPELHPANHGTLMVDMSLCSQAEYQYVHREVGKREGAAGTSALMQLYAANGMATVVTAASGSGPSSSAATHSWTGSASTSQGALPTAAQMLRVTEVDEQHNNGPTSALLLERAEKLQRTIKRFAEFMGNYDRMYSCQCVEEACDVITDAMKASVPRARKAVLLLHLTSMPIYLNDGSVRPKWSSFVNSSAPPAAASASQAAPMKATGTGSVEWFLHISQGGDYIANKRERMQHAEAVHRSAALLQQDEEGILPWKIMRRPPPPPPAMVHTALSQDRSATYALKTVVPYSPLRVELIARDLDALHRLPAFILEYSRMGAEVRERQKEIIQTLTEACESENERMALPWPKHGSKAVRFASDEADTAHARGRAANDSAASLDEVKALVQTITAQKKALDVELTYATSRLRYKETTLTTIERMEACRKRSSLEVEGVSVVPQGTGVGAGSAADDELRCICLNIITDMGDDAEKEYGPPMLLPCGHMLHEGCYSRMRKTAEEAHKQPLCPNCREPIDTGSVCPLVSSVSVIGGVVQSVDLSWYIEDALGQSSAVSRVSPGRAKQKDKGSTTRRLGQAPETPLPAVFDAFGTKVNVLLSYLRRLPAGEKAVVVCSFQDMLPVLKAAATMLDDHLQSTMQGATVAEQAVPAVTAVEEGAGVSSQSAGCLAGARLKTVILHGSGQERAHVVESFNTDPTVRILLLQSETDCAGLTLTAANHLFVVDPVLSQSTMTQLVGRICRQGQTRPCFVYHFLQERTVEEELFKRRVLSFGVSSSSSSSNGQEQQGGAGSTSAAGSGSRQQTSRVGSSSSARSPSGPVSFELHDILNLFGQVEEGAGAGAEGRAAEEDSMPADIQ